MNDAIRGIIPARAGFTCPTTRHSWPGKDHPRSRGVYHALNVKTTNGDGSSPLARGLLVPPRLGFECSGIIPARAGFTALPVLASRGADGSSPLARGLQELLEHVVLSAGIIPARAGFTPGCPPGSSSDPGSSPLARGLPQVQPPRGRGGRIIPARAGFTRDTTIRAAQMKDHPRSRGVYNAAQTSDQYDEGSSPLARGLR